MHLTLINSHKIIQTEPKEPQEPYPTCLEGHASAADLEEITSVTLPNGQMIESGDFVVVSCTSLSGCQVALLIGLLISVA
jgi:hypothetical protein